MQNVFEPFPTFFLKYQEMRSKRGFLDNVAEAKRKGNQPDRQIKQTDDKNKNVELMRAIFIKLQAPITYVSKSSDEESLQKLMSEHQGSHENGMLCYKMVKYVIATNRLVLTQLSGEEIVSLLAINHARSKDSQPTASSTSLLIMRASRSAFSSSARRRKARFSLSTAPRSRTGTLFFATVCATFLTRQ